MQDFPRQAVAALKVYLDRGREAIDLLSSGKVGEASTVLKWRKAAFHNFCWLDRMATDSGHDVREQPEVVALIDEIEVINQRLGILVQNSGQQLKVDLVALSASRAKLGQFRSGRRTRNKFYSSA